MAVKDDVRVISVIVPVYNDPQGLTDTLDSIVKQDFPHSSFEVIVADNGSADGTQKVAQMFADKHADIVRVVIEDTVPGSYAARNKGIEVSSGEIVAFVDADMSVPPDWLSRIGQHFANDNCDYLGARVHLYSTRHTMAALFNIVTGFRVGEVLEESHYAPTCCLTVRRSVFEKIGTFDLRLQSGGDTEFGQRAWKAGFQLNYAPDIIMRHPARSTLRALMKKSFRFGYHARARMARLYPEYRTDIARNYRSARRYMPGRIWRIRNDYRCGAGYRIPTVLGFAMIPMILQWTSLYGFCLANVRSLFGRH
jgi:glycosyltransferase AglI